MKAGRGWWTLAFGACLALAASGGGAAAHERPTLNGLACSAHDLEKQGFNSALDDGASFTELGDIKGASIRYRVYFYDHENPVSQHGISALIFMVAHFGR